MGISHYDHAVQKGRMTMTTESSKGCNNNVMYEFFGYIGHVSMFTIMCCLVVGLGSGLELGSDLVSGWLVIVHT